MAAAKVADTAMKQTFVREGKSLRGEPRGHDLARGGRHDPVGAQLEQDFVELVLRLEDGLLLH